MAVHAFRFDNLRFRSGFTPRKPRHPLLRFALGVVGVGVLALLVMFSVVLGAVMIAAGVAYKLLRHRRHERARDRVVEGEYQVVATPTLTRRS
ncbi:MAG TPA: hypothetical protein VEY50_04130 [Lysobacter sp.]|nr:hypothetical protein [Lysobacter sp.]